MYYVNLNKQEHTSSRYWKLTNKMRFYMNGNNLHCTKGMILKLKKEEFICRCKKRMMLKKKIAIVDIGLYRP
jgi:hypothetical protein